MKFTQCLINGTLITAKQRKEHGFHKRKIKTIQHKVFVQIIDSNDKDTHQACMEVDGYLKDVAIGVPFRGFELASHFPSFVVCFFVTF